MHTFPYDGKYLMQNGMKEGYELGIVLKKIEAEWIDNAFKISKDRVKEIIKFNCRVFFKSLSSACLLR